MFAFDTMLPINGLFVLFILLCIYACGIGIIEAPQDPTDHEMPAAFRDMSGRREGPAGKNGHGSDSARRGWLNGNSKDRGK